MLDEERWDGNAFDSSVRETERDSIVVGETKHIRRVTGSGEKIIFGSGKGREVVLV